MSAAQATRQFRPTLGTTLFFSLVVVACLGAGVWQLQRADEKRELHRQHALRLNATPVMLAALSDGNADAIRYTPIIASGEFNTALQFRVGPRRKQGRIGFRHIAPLTTATGQLLLVDRGWIAEGQPLPPPPSGRVTLAGWVVPVALPPVQLTANERGDSAWREPWVYVDLVRFAQLTGFAAKPWVLRLQPHSVGALETEAPTPPTGPAMHIGYAIQWLVFALIGVVIWVILSRRKVELIDE
jgi:surfeit locus 1 family protein